MYLALRDASVAAVVELRAQGSRERDLGPPLVLTHEPRGDRLRAGLVLERHGTRYRYGLGCRCADCRAANWAYMSAYYRRNRRR